MSEITDLTAWELAAAIEAGDLSCRDLMQAVLARIDAVNPRHNAIVSLRDPDALLQEADRCDLELVRSSVSDPPRSFLFGVPQAIKDVVPTAGIRTTFGSPILADAVPTADALLVQRVKAAGGIVIGKTNTPEFGLGSHTFNEVFGATRNAYDPTRTAGGSSGGAAVALATRMLPVADGSDTMGSLRNPAAWNNVFGFRPSVGRIPSFPSQDAWVTTLSSEGPMARNVRDLALLLDVQAGYDPRVPLSLASEPSFAARLEAGGDTGRPRIGWLGDLDGHLAMAPGILEACGTGLGRLVDAGCAVETLSLGFAPERVWDAWLVLRHWIMGARLAVYLKTPTNRALMKPEALWEHDQGTALTASRVMAASIERTAFHRHLVGLFERFDFLALPSTQVWPFDVTERWPREIAGRTMDTYHRWMEVVVIAALAGLPAVSVPVGFDADGLPAGIQLIGKPRDDLGLLRLARRYEEAARDVLARRPPEPQPS